MFWYEVKAVLLCLLLVAASHRAEKPKPDLRLLHATEQELKAYLSQTKAGGSIAPVSFSLDYKFSPQQCTDDLIILKRAMESVQTSLYRYSSKAQIDSMFEQAFAACEDSLSYLAFIRTIAPIFSQVGCIHSNWGHSKEYLHYRKDNMRFFPLEVVLLENKLFVTQDLSLENSIPGGSTIASINGKPAEAVIKEIQRNLVSDGTNQSSRSSAIGKLFPLAYSVFIGLPESFNLGIIPPQQYAVKSFNVRPLKLAEIDAIRKQRNPDMTTDKPLQFEYLDTKRAGIYTIRWFNKEYIAAKGQNFEAFTDSVFHLLEKNQARNLIIDIRDNGGGWTAFGKYLFSYFIDKPTPYMERVLAKKTKDYFFEPIMASPPEYHDTMQLVAGPDGRLEWKNYPNLLAIPATANRFRGRTMVLMNGNSQSCSSLFATLMREHTDAIFIGEECGGASCGPNGMTTSFILPHTRVSITLSTALYTTAISDKSNSRGVMPDHFVQPSIEGLLRGEDTLLQYAISLAKD